VVAGNADDRLFDDWTRDYAVLGLRLDRVVPGVVLAWLGPTAWSDAVRAENPVPPRALVEAADDLLSRLPRMGYPVARVRHLAGQAAALETVARLADGETVPYAEQVERLLGMRAHRAPEARLDAVVRDLDALLPGTGSPTERYRAWRRGVAVPDDRVPDALARVLAEVRRRTREHVPLPDDERVDFLFDAELPYRAYARYLGRYRSRIEVNDARPLPFDELVDYAAHEAYPGHHTEHASREHLLYRRGGQGEYAIQVAPTPAALVWEAVATCARDLVLTDAEAVRLPADLAIPLGPEADPERDARIWALVGELDAAQGNAAFLLHEEGRPRGEVAEYLAARSLLPLDAARRTVELLDGFPWGVYAQTYAHGRRLLRPLIAGPDRWTAFRRVLTEPAHPAWLAFPVDPGR
jgi:hypothetical protein